MNVTFDEFFEAVWGFAPYPWQSELARTVQHEGWPGILDLPTGTGKTAVLDIALHHLALDGGQSAPRRILMVVDRRVIVDQVGRRAQSLLDALRDTDESVDPERRAVLLRMREALRAMVGEYGPLLHTEVLRGGVRRHDAWALYPHVPVLAGSTVDQVGSRLFFRGYGVSDTMRPIHAGLLGCDTLYFLDEVHLSRPFADVLAQLERVRGPENGVIRRRFGVVQLSATPGKSTFHAAGIPIPEAASLDTLQAAQPGTENVFRLTEADRENARLARILGASKPAALEMVEVRSRSGDGVKRRAVADRAAYHARAMITEGRHAVAVVVNRVDTARRAWSLLQSSSFDTVLVTGRMRPLDQERVLASMQGRVIAGRAADLESRPIVVVATQCIEAGADYDFDGLVTECASIDALRQRFGRLDRAGRYVERAEARHSDDGLAANANVHEVSPDFGRRGVTARAVILGRSDMFGSAVDPVYGQALRKTWEWLSEVATDETLDFGIDALEPLLQSAGDRLNELLAGDREAPVLLPAYLDQWAQTNPRPFADPDVSLFLHGIPHNARDYLSDVRVVWRSDIEEEDLERGAADTAVLMEHMAVVPPGTLEAMSLPVWTVKRWLSNAEAAQDDDVADVEGAEPPVQDNMGESRRVIVWRGKTRSEIIDSEEIAPGEIVIVPESYGGIGVHGTFDSTVHRPRDASVHASLIYDLGDVVQFRQRGRPTLRLDARVLRPLMGGRVVDLPDVSGEEVDARRVLGEAVAEIRASATAESPAWFRELLEAVGDHPHIVSSPRGGWIAITRPRKLRMNARKAGESSHGATLPSDTLESIEPSGGGEDDDESFIGDASPSPLLDHLSGVGDLAELFASHAGLPRVAVSSLKWAGRFHDAGKSDPRFQVWLYSGDAIAARYGAMLAKSATPWQDVAGRTEARRRARYPVGQRHELVSLDMMERAAPLKAAAEEDGADWQLILHLVATHHGWCRAVAPVAEFGGESGDTVSITHSGIEINGSTAHGRGQLDSGVTNRFWTLNRRYGWHELAYLEAILRLADHRQSALEAER